MSQKIKIRMFLGFAILCWCVVACWAMYTHQQGSAVDPIYPSIHGDVYATNSTFSVYGSGDVQKLNGVVGAVLPNANNNPNALGAAMATLKHNIKSDTVVVIAFGDNIGNVPLTGDWGWQTPYCVVQTDKDVLNTLVSYGMLSDNLALDKVTDLGLVMDYCSYYLQEKSVVPVVLDKTMSTNDVAKALLPYKNVLNKYPILVATPKINNQEVLPISDMASLSDLIASANTMNYDGIFQSESNLALKTMALLLPEPHGNIVTTSYSGDKAEKFSDLLIFCED
ncbi:MAG: hypothetical protein RR233_08745 [Clostridiales bacterium]